MKNQYGEFTPYALTDEQKETIQQAADTLFSITYGLEEKTNPVEARLCSALMLVQEQLYSVLNADLTPLKD